MPDKNTTGAVAIYASAGPHLIRFDVDGADMLERATGYR